MMKELSVTIKLSISVLSLLIFNDICLLYIVKAFLPNWNTNPEVKKNDQDS